MQALDFNLEKEKGNYLDEKELFILYSLYKNKHISTLYSNVFTRYADEIIVKSEKTSQKTFDRLTHKGQSVIVLDYLLHLGKELDEEGFSIYCNADYSLLEGGFLNENFHNHISSYLELSKNEREEDDMLSKEQKAFLDRIISQKRDSSSLQTQIDFDRFANQPVEAYREAIINKKADSRFIELVNKLITADNNGGWDTEDTQEFLDIWYQNNKIIEVNREEGFLYENCQKELARLIFENVDIQLSIKNTEKLNNYLARYITMFQEDTLEGTSRTGLTRSFYGSLSKKLYATPYGYARQKEILVQHIEDVYQEYKKTKIEIHNPFIEPEYIGDQQVGTMRLELRESNDKKRDSFLFVHTVIALEYEGYCDVGRFSYGPSRLFDLYDRGFLFEITLNSTPTENSKENKESAKQLDVVYFDRESSKIIYDENEVKITKGKDIYYVIKYLFEREDVYEECFYDEIRDDSELNDGKKRTDKNIYDALKQFNKRLINKGIDDFFVINFHSIKIREKYKVTTL